MFQLVMIAAGGAVGAVLRYLVSGWGQNLVDTSFPSGTLLVNLSGCLLIGFLAPALAGPLLVREDYRMGILIGCLGAFTTFSTFGLETVELLRDGQFPLAAAYVVASNVCGFFAVWLGLRTSQAVFGV